MSRRVYLLGVGLALVALGLAATDALLKPAPGATEANARRIRPGMTMAEVEVIVGGRFTCPGGKRPDGCPFTALAPGTDVNILIGFDEGHRVADVFIGYVNGKPSQRVTPDPSLLDRLRAWLRW